MKKLFIFFVILLFSPLFSNAATGTCFAVGGGGGGARTYNSYGIAPGGAGAGGTQINNSCTLTATTYAVTIGAGGTGATAAATPGTIGATTTFNGLSAGSGGGGGVDSALETKQGYQASGAGSMAHTCCDSPGLGTAGWGNNGGSGTGVNNGSGSGGGGAGGVGGNSVEDGAGGAGGNGTTTTIIGSSELWACGGGGGGDAGDNAGGAGGDCAKGGTGGTGSNPTTAGTAGNANSGVGGGGGGAHVTAAASGNGGNGGSGIAIVSFLTADFTFTYSGTYSEGTNGANTWVKMTSSGDLILSTAVAGDTAPRKDDVHFFNLIFPLKEIFYA